jgi:hypothetical protein
MARPIIYDDDAYAATEPERPTARIVESSDLDAIRADGRRAGAAAQTARA